MIRDRPEFFSGGCPDSLYFDSALERPSVFPALFEDPEHVCEHACRSNKKKAIFDGSGAPPFGERRKIRRPFAQLPARAGVY